MGGAARWLARHRLLLFVCAAGAAMGTREYRVSRAGGTAGGPGGCQASAASCFSLASRAGPADDSAFWRWHARLVEIVARLNPDDPDTDFIRGMQALAEGDGEEFTRRFEEATARGVKHNDILLQYYAQYLLDRGAEWWRVNRALNRWRENHPFSGETIWLPLAEGPRTPAEERVLYGALAEVPWIGGARLEAGAEGAARRWRLVVSFRPGRTVDLRDAVAAVTVLSLSGEERARFRVTCSTLRNCRKAPRPGR